MKVIDVSSVLIFCGILIKVQIFRRWSSQRIAKRLLLPLRRSFVPKPFY